MSERKGSLVNNTEMDEPLFDGRSQHRVLSAEDEWHMASPGCERRHGKKEQDGTCPKDPSGEVLAGLTEEVREEPSYKVYDLVEETKAEEAGRCRLRHAASYEKCNVGAAMTDGTVVLMMRCESRAEGRVSTDTQ